MKEEEQKKVNKEGPKEDKKVPDAKEVKKELPKPTVEELQKQVIFLTRQSAEAQKRAKEAEDRAKSEDAKIQAALSQYVRLQADFDNFRRRNASIRLDSYEEGKRDTVKELLPALDNLERALDAIPAENASLREGIAMVQRQMLDSLKKLGLEEVESDCVFDPTKHEAVMREKVEGKESGEIVVVFQKGYRMGGRIIRHCMVKVAE